MRENPLKISQSELRKFASLHMYTGTPQQPPPKSGSVIREKSFDTVLDLEGDDFYRGKVKLIPGSYTKLFSSIGSFSGVSQTADAEFARVSKNILNQILSNFLHPHNWGRLLDPDRRLLASFSRKVKTVVEITKGKNLVIKGIRKSGKQETFLNLPHPSLLNAKRYVIEITNQDAERHSPPENDQDVIKNCAAFVHHSDAIKSIQTNGMTGSNKSVSRISRPIYGLTKNIDYSAMNEDRQDLILQRSDDACCISCQISVSESIL
jgi:hypothetical protein